MFDILTMSGRESESKANAFPLNSYVHNHEKAKPKNYAMYIALFFKSVNERCCFCNARRVQVRVRVRVRSFNKIFQVTLIIWSVLSSSYYICCYCWLRGRTSGPFRPQFIVRFLFALFVLVLSISLQQIRRCFIGSHLSLFGLEIFYFCE